MNGKRQNYFVYQHNMSVAWHFNGFNQNVCLSKYIYTKALFIWLNTELMQSDWTEKHFSCCIPTRCVHMPYLHYAMTPRVGLSWRSVQRRLTHRPLLCVTLNPCLMTLISFQVMCWVFLFPRIMRLGPFAAPRETLCCVLVWTLPAGRPLYLPTPPFRACASLSECRSDT